MSPNSATFDGNGNIIGLVDMATGAKSATYEYSAFGETIISDGPAAELFPFRFSTKFTDTETGLLYYGFRYYSTGAGRWMSRDPIEERGGMNLYAFVGNDGVNAIDATGLFKGTYHRSITRAGLSHSGLGQKGIDWIIEANVGQDDGVFTPFDYSTPFADPLNHGDNNQLFDTINRIRQRLNEAAEMACADCDNVKAQLQLFGRALHGLQDIYAHSTYVEMTSSPTSTPGDVPLWQLTNSNGIINIPPGVISGNYEWPDHGVPPSHAQLNKDQPDSERGCQWPLHNRPVVATSKPATLRVDWS